MFGIVAIHYSHVVVTHNTTKLDQAGHEMLTLTTVQKELDVAMSRSQRTTNVTSR